MDDKSSYFQFRNPDFKHLEQIRDCELTLTTRNNDLSNQQMTSSNRNDFSPTILEFKSKHDKTDCKLIERTDNRIETQKQ